MRCLALGLILATAFLALPVATAQNPAAAHPSPELKTLYAHHHDSDTEELSGWMNTDVVDPTGNDIALGPPGSSVGGAVPAPQQIDRTYTITLAPALGQTLQLDPAGNIVVDAYVGAGSGNGVVTVETAITYGGETLAEGAPQNHVVQQAGTGQYGKLTWTIAPALDELAPGEDLVWTVSLSGAATAVFLSVSPERGSSAITLPILAVVGEPPQEAASTVYEELDGETADVAETFDAPTTADHVYNWTTDLEEAVLRFTGDVANGSASVTILDGGNGTAFDGDFEPGANHSLEAEPGGWAIQVSFDGFAGTFGLEIAALSPIGSPPPPPPPAPPPGPPSPPGEDGQDDGNGTVEKEEAKESPGPGLALAGLLLLAVAASRRRR